MKARKTPDILIASRCASIQEVIGDADRLRILAPWFVEEMCVNEPVRQVRCSHPQTSIIFAISGMPV